MVMFCGYECVEQKYCKKQYAVSFSILICDPTFRVCLAKPPRRMARMGRPGVCPRRTVGGLSWTGRRARRAAEGRGSGADARGARAGGLEQEA